MCRNDPVAANVRVAFALDNLLQLVVEYFDSV
jgi:hypothetical protein